MKTGIYKTLPIASIVPYAENARTHSPEQIAQLEASIREFGFTNPILVDEQNGLIAGHGRLIAARNVGMTDIPSIEITGLTDDQRRALILADNKLALNAGWDENKLRLELTHLREAGFDFDLVGFSKIEMDDLFYQKGAGLTDDDSVPESGPPVSTHGDIWVLGNHRVLCGSSTADNLGYFVEPATVDLVWTDPPYNVNYETKAGKIANDSQSDQDFRAFLFAAYTNMITALKPGGAIYVAHADTEGLNFRRGFRDVGFKLSGCLIWEKNALVLGRSDYQWQHEPILYGWKPGAAHRWYGGRKQTTIVDMAPDLVTPLQDGTYSLRVGDRVLILSGTDIMVEELHGSVMRENRPRRSEDHPTMKPVRLVERCLENSSLPGDKVFDPFGGSGSTLIACEKLGRIARLVELDGKYVDVIVKRWQEYTGKKATLQSSGLTFEDVQAERHTGENS